jgi:hypothetical protein
LGSTAFALHLQVQDRVGNPVAGLGLKFSDQRFSGWPKGWGEPDPLFTTTTDHAGHAEVLLSRSRTIYVKAVSEVWQLETSIDAKPGVVPVLMARAVATVYLSVVTDAGEPWYGQARITAAGDGHQFHAFIKEGEITKLERLPVDDLTVLFYECMIGVDEQSHAISAADVKDGVTIHITLRTNPKNNNGAIEVDVTGYVGEIKELRILIAESGALTWVEPGTSLRTVKVWRSRPLWPQSYTIRIVGHSDFDPVWTSDLVAVQPRKITRVAVTMDQVCSVQASVVDDQSVPITGAVLLLGEDTLPNLDFISGSPGSVAVTDAVGSATLNGLRPGRHKLTVAAKGFEPQVLDAELAGGQLLVLGVVRLAKAAGSITVTLKGMREKQQYSIMVLKPGGTALHTAKNVGTDVTTFSGLSLNTYVVAVVTGRGGRPITVTITLTGSEPTASVNLDVSALVETPLD